MFYSFIHISHLKEIHAIFHSTVMKIVFGYNPMTLNFKSLIIIELVMSQVQYTYHDSLKSADRKMCTYWQEFTLLLFCVFALALWTSKSCFKFTNVYWKQLLKDVDSRYYMCSFEEVKISCHILRIFCFLRLLFFLWN